MEIWNRRESIPPSLIIASLSSLARAGWARSTLQKTPARSQSRNQVSTPGLVADEQAKKRLVREARAAAKLDHPNICSIYEVGEDDERSFIVLQYIEGETLATKIQRNPLELKDLLDIGLQLSDALAEAHSHGIIHRDIKPQNIMITAKGQAKVMDFGLAKVVRATRAPKVDRRNRKPAHRSGNHRARCRICLPSSKWRSRLTLAATYSASDRCCTK